GLVRYKRLDEETAVNGTSPATPTISRIKPTVRVPSFELPVSGSTTNRVGPNVPTGAAIHTGFPAFAGGGPKAWRVPELGFPATTAASPATAPTRPALFRDNRDPTTPRAIAHDAASERGSEAELPSTSSADAPSFAASARSAASSDAISSATRSGTRSRRHSR